jgi:hypothetical protein
MTVREQLEQRLGSLPGLDRRKSRYGSSSAYYVGEREIVHFHGDQRMDVRLTSELIRTRKQEGGLDPRITTRGASANWAAVRVTESNDIPLAVALVEDAIRANQ